MSDTAVGYTELSSTPKKNNWRRILLITGLLLVLLGVLATLLALYAGAMLSIYITVPLACVFLLAGYLYYRSTLTPTNQAIGATPQKSTTDPVPATELHPVTEKPKPIIVSKKIVLIGPKEAGKSAILRRYLDDDFSEEQKISTRKFESREAKVKNCRLEFVDTTTPATPPTSPNSTPNSKKRTPRRKESPDTPETPTTPVLFTSQQPAPKLTQAILIHLEDAHLVILAYDISNSKSFETVKEQFTMIREKNKDIPVLLLGCKKDKTREVATDTVQKFARENNLAFAETSANTREGIDEAFELLMQQLEPKEQKKTVQLVSV